MNEGDPALLAISFDRTDLTIWAELPFWRQRTRAG
jgi:hypothetical protein